MKAQQTGYMVSGGGHLLLLLWGVFAFTNAPPMKLEDSIPVEVVSELPQTTLGEKQAEKPLDKPAKKVDVVKPEVKDDDDDDKPIAKEKIKSAESLPPPPPPPPKKVELKPEPPKPAPPKVAPPQKAVAEADKEELEDKLAELAAKQKKEKLAKEKAEKEAKDKAAKELAAKEAKEKAAKELAAKEAKEQADKDAKERLEARKFDANALAKKLGSAVPLADSRPATSTQRTGETLAPKSSAGAQSGRNTTLSASETAAIKEKIEKCWNTASLSINAKNFVVKVQFNMDENGNVTGSPIVTNRQAGAEFAAAAGSAVRAVRGCSPLPVPKNKYEAWKEGINLTFNLADLM